MQREPSTGGADSGTGQVVAERYELDSLVGRGSLGAVYRSVDRFTGNEVAIKLLHAHHHDSQREIETFWREARAGELVNHPNVMRVLDSGSDPLLHDYVVLELVTGRTLEDVVAAKGQPPLAWTLDVIDQLLSGLQAIHEAGVVHRDVKPDNIVIERRRLVDAGQLERLDHVKLCDFGLAKLPRTESVAEPLDTLAGTLCGTPEYIAPEQAQGRSVGPAADIYSCGVILYQLVTGRLPFRGGTPMAIAAKHISKPVPKPCEFRPDLDPRLERIILKALHKRASGRFAGALAMRAALESLSDPNAEPIGPSDSDRPPPLRTRWDEEPTRVFRPMSPEDASSLLREAKERSGRNRQSGRRAGAPSASRAAQGLAARPLPAVAPVLLGALVLVTLLAAWLAL